MTTDLQPMGRKLIIGSTEMGLPNVKLRNGNGHNRAHSMLQNYNKTLEATPASRNNNLLNNQASQRTLNHEGSVPDLKQLGTPNRFEMTSNASV